MILGIDPGLTNGIVFLDADEGVPEPRSLVVEHAQVPFPDLPSHLEYRLPEVDLVAIERFVITARTVTLSRQYAPLYAIGGVMFLAKLSGVPVRLQSPADAKRCFPDEVLKDMGLYRAVKGDHARDALRHALLAARRPNFTDSGKDPDSLLH